METTAKDIRPKRVLIVGAGGFVGSFIAERALELGLDTWCGVRESTSRRWLTDPRLKFVTLDFDSEEAMADTLATTLPQGEKWDYIVYNLGATKCLNFADFNRINYGILRNFTEALKRSDKIPEKLLYMSSMSALGPGDEKGYTPYTERSLPHPDTKYGASKLKAEMWLATSGIPHVVFRSTGVYGPRDRDYYLMFQSINRGWDFSVGLRKQLLTFIYAEDLARAIFMALEKAPVGKTYLIAEPRAYTQSEFRRLVCRALGKRCAIGVRLPLFAVRLVSKIAELWGIARLKPSTLNTDKYHIMRQRNWSADTSAALRDFGFEAEVPLSEGVDRSVKWYRSEGWL